MSLYSLITEAKSKVYGSKEGTKGKGRKGVTKSQKSRVKVYPSIMSALKHGSIGDIFSTDGSERLYVITVQKWGHDKDQVYAGKTAKGFTPGSATPNASWGSIKKHSVRTRLRHGKLKSKKLLSKYGSKSMREKAKK